MLEQRRRHLRVPIEVELRCREGSGKGQLVFGTRDLSAGGAFVKSDLLLEEGEPLSLGIALPGEKVLKAEAKVAWVRRFPRLGQEAGMGIEFVSIANHDRRSIDAFLERQLEARGLM
jgi:c-di-GMP-binding flagellar brake protein YcgR